MKKKLGTLKSDLALVTRWRDILLGCPRREAGSVRDRHTAQHVHPPERRRPPGPVDQEHFRGGAQHAGGVLPHSDLHQGDM